MTHSRSRPMALLVCAIIVLAPGTGRAQTPDLTRLVSLQEPKKLVELPEPVAPPAAAKPAEPPDDGKFDIRIPLGEVFKVRPPSGLPVKEAFVDRDKILKIFAFEKKTQVIKAFGVGLGDARLTIIDIKDTPKTFRVRVVPSLDYMEHLLDRQFPSSRLKLSAVADNILLVEGHVDSPGHVEQVVGLLENVIGKQGRIVNNIRLGGVMQVQLNICIARVDRREVRRLNFNFLGANTNTFFGSQIGNLIGVPGVSVRGGEIINGGAKVFSPSTTNGQVLTGSSTAFFGVTNETEAFFGFLEALKQQGIVKVLANPTLMTMNGRPADFLVGGEQPVPTVIFAGGTAQPNVQFKSFGTRLTFVPILLGDGKLRLEVLPEVSTVNFSAGITTGGILVPQFVTQRLHTTVEMESGQTLYLGGLLQNEVEGDVQKLPVLGELPWVGSLFRRISHQHRETELVVAVTPRLVDPLRPCQKPTMLPGDESRNPTDYELFLRGRLEVAPPPPAHPRNRLTYPPPTSLSPPIAPTDPHPAAPVHGPFGPASMPAPSPVPTNAEPAPAGPVYGPFGPSVGSVSLESAPATAARPAPSVPAKTANPPRSWRRSLSPAQPPANSAAVASGTECTPDAIAIFDVSGFTFGSSTYRPVSDVLSMRFEGR